MLVTGFARYCGWRVPCSGPTSPDLCLEGHVRISTRSARDGGLVAGVVQRRLLSRCRGATQGRTPSGPPNAVPRTSHSSFDIEVLRSCTRALSEHRIGLMQLEWNETSQLVLGANRHPVVELLAQNGYQLSRPNPQGRLMPVADYGFGADVFARPM
jgi:hypothetical protein